MFADVAAFLISGLVAVAVRYGLRADFAPSYYLSFLPAVILFMVVFGFVNLYPGIPVNPMEEFRGILRATTVTYLIVIGTTFFTKQSRSSRMIFILAWLLTVVLLPPARNAMRSWCARQSWWGIPAVILGAGATGQAMLGRLQQQPSLGLRPVAVLRSGGRDESNVSQSNDGLFLGDFSDAPLFASKYRTCYAIIAMPHLESQQLTALLAEYTRSFSHVLVIPDLFGMSSLWVSAKDIAGVLSLEISQTLSHRSPQMLKRAVDLLISITSCILLLPMFALIYLLARLSSSDPVFYGQRRIGRDNKEFTAWKFRTMIMNADAVLEQRLKEDPWLREEWNRDHKLKNDPRVTPIGRILRKISLDELPQLWNVLRGQMSLVGPRPIVSAEVDKYGKRFAHYRRVPPGITGLWQISGRNNTTYEERTQLDEYYVQNWSISLDFYILFCTFKAVLLSEGAY